MFHYSHWPVYVVDLENPVGYPIGTMLHSLLAFYLLHNVACFLSIPLGAYLVVNSLNGFLKSDLKSINKVAKERKSKPDILKAFYRLIRSHADIKQLRFNDSECLNFQWSMELNIYSF